MPPVIAAVLPSNLLDTVFSFVAKLELSNSDASIT